MRTIWKYELAVEDDQTINMPEDAYILSVHTQVKSVSRFRSDEEVICLWALVDTKKPSQERGVSVRGTGSSCDDLPNTHFLGSVFFTTAPLVFHIFIDRLF